MIRGLEKSQAQKQWLQVIRVQVFIGKVLGSRNRQTDEPGACCVITAHRQPKNS